MSAFVLAALIPRGWMVLEIMIASAPDKNGGVRERIIEKDEIRSAVARSFGDIASKGQRPSCGGQGLDRNLKSRFSMQSRISTFDCSGEPKPSTWYSMWRVFGSPPWTTFATFCIPKNPA